MMKQLSILILCFFIIKNAFAQDGHYTLQQQNPLYLNPALIGGGKEAFRVGGIYRSQWKAIDATYNNYSIFADAKISNFALGFLIHQNQAGTTGYKKTNALIAAGYRQPIGDGLNSLSIGAQVGLNQTLIDPTRLTFDSQYNPSFGYDESLSTNEQNLNGSTRLTDLNIGATYEFDVDATRPISGEVGLGIYHANAPEITLMDGSTTTLSRKVILHGRSFFQFSSAFGIEPMAILAFQGDATNAVLGLNLGFNMSDTSGFKIGVGTRLRDALFIQTQFNMRSITLGLAFDYTISDLQTTDVTNNSLEISMIYHIPFKNSTMKDQDKDGVVDHNDKCPEVPGLPELEGCPQELATSPVNDTKIHVVGMDYDKDGILDDNDLCPYEFGYARYQGCNDTDADGIWDHIDVCPSLPGKIENHGCPVEIPGIDSDRDGVPDRFDKCIYIKGLEIHNGCPDTDGDDISDLNDDCPYIKGARSNNGCPIDKNDNIGPAVKRISIENIEFETDNDNLTAYHHQTLDELAAMLNAGYHYKVIVEGHTDNEGSTTYNFQLSQRRAFEVKNYLMSKGVSSDKIETHFFGETKPVTSNQSSFGKARNRRVELILLEMD